ncbi:E3 ubiquitin-protein ligase TRIM39 [Hippocampus zosterae]|uniref:E3 ubiquitin-protein ligase TRIM39 n=1 Tax=Hippocampus zosterae TaxID=109293 RepID=UPI00223DE63B|nr:E3 ubiquitin-protein ligase TRIM39 [Hippocampus zosterae]
MEMKSILKSDRKKVSLLKAQEHSTKQSSSVGALRWCLPEEDIQAHNSAPSRPVASGKLTGHSQTQQRPRQSSLNDLRSLQECVQFLQHWKEQVDQVCKRPVSAPGTSNAAKSDSRTERSLEESRKLILEWANELRHVDKVRPRASDLTADVSREKPHALAQVVEGKPCSPETEEPNKDLDANEDAQLRVMEWAKEVQKVSESCGVQSDELGKVLRLLGLKKKRLVSLLPLLEFITWSLLLEDSVGTIPQLWLPVKQRTWKAGTSRYIPNSVWSWICSAEADVILDPTTNHPWLTLSEDRRQVQEGPSQAHLPYSSQRFDGWPCVLAWEGYGRGRHYWEVDIANDGYWRVGLAAARSKRSGRFHMCPETGYWCLWRGTHRFYACTQPETALPAGLVPRRLGVYLDCEEGQVSFYNAQSRTHIYTFTGDFKGKVYPFFAPLDGRTLMTVAPPRAARSTA